MNRRFLFLALVASTLLLACGATAAAPPSIDLRVAETLHPGLQGAYCWDRALGGTICVDPIEPSFDGAVPIPADGTLQLELETPLPDTLTLTLSREVFGEHLFSASVDPKQVVTWTPAVEPGEYVLQALAAWPQGTVAYWFLVSLP